MVEGIYTAPRCKDGQPLAHPNTETGGCPPASRRIPSCYVLYPTPHHIRKEEERPLKKETAGCPAISRPRCRSIAKPPCADIQTTATLRVRNMRPSLCDVRYVSAPPAPPNAHPEDNPVGEDPHAKKGGPDPSRSSEK